MARRNHHITIAEQLRIVTMQKPLRGLINQNILEYHQRDIQDLDQNQGQDHDHDPEPRHQKKIVNASRSVDTSLKRSINTSQNLELSDMSMHRDDGNRSLPCNNSI